MAQRQRKPKAPWDTTKHTPMALEELQVGTVAYMALATDTATYINCPACKGTGYNLSTLPDGPHGYAEKCPRCKGSNRIWNPTPPRLAVHPMLVSVHHVAREIANVHVACSGGPLTVETRVRVTLHSTNMTSLVRNADSHNHPCHDRMIFRTKEEASTYLAAVDAYNVALVLTGHPEFFAR